MCVFSPPKDRARPESQTIAANHPPRGALSGPDNLPIAVCVIGMCFGERFIQALEDFVRSDETYCENALVSARASNPRVMNSRCVLRRSMSRRTTSSTKPGRGFVIRNTGKRLGNGCRVLAPAKRQWPNAEYSRRPASASYLPRQRQVGFLLDHGLCERERGAQVFGAEVRIFIEDLFFRPSGGLQAKQKLHSESCALHTRAPPQISGSDSIRDFQSMSFFSRSFVSNLLQSPHQQQTAAEGFGGHPDMGAVKSPSPMTLPWPMPISNALRGIGHYEPSFKECRIHPDRIAATDAVRHYPGRVSIRARP